MPGRDKDFYKSDILRGLDEDEDLFPYPYSSPSVDFTKLFKDKTKPKVQPKPRSNIPGPITRHNEFNVVAPGQKLKALKETIRKQQTKPTLEQHHQYYELSEEIDRRGDAYFRKLDELDKSKENKNYGKKEKS